MLKIKLTIFLLLLNIFLLYGYEDKSKDSGTKSFKQSDNQNNINRELPKTVEESNKITKFYQQFTDRPKKYIPNRKDSDRDTKFSESHRSDKKEFRDAEDSPRNTKFSSDKENFRDNNRDSHRDKKSFEDNRRPERNFRNDGDSGRGGGKFFDGNRRSEGNFRNDGDSRGDGGRFFEDNRRSEGNFRNDGDSRRDGGRFFEDNRRSERNFRNDGDSGRGGGRFFDGNRRSEGNFRNDGDSRRGGGRFFEDNRRSERNFRNDGDSGRGGGRFFEGNRRSEGNFRNDGDSRRGGGSERNFRNDGDSRRGGGSERNFRNDGDSRRGGGRFFEGNRRSERNFRNDGDSRRGGGRFFEGNRRSERNFRNDRDSRRGSGNFFEDKRRSDRNFRNVKESRRDGRKFFDDDRRSERNFRNDGDSRRDGGKFFEDDRRSKRNFRNDDDSGDGSKFFKGDRRSVRNKELGDDEDLDRNDRHVSRGDREFTRDEEFKDEGDSDKNKKISRSNRKPAKDFTGKSSEPLTKDTFSKKKTNEKNVKRTTVSDRSLNDTALEDFELTEGQIEIGTTCFSDLRIYSSLFVDKSLLIRDFLNSQDRVTVLKRPKRFGKTINSDMLKTFLTMELDKHSNPVPVEELPATVNHCLFCGGDVQLNDRGKAKVRHLDKLKIADHPNLVTKYRGKFPVIFLSFGDFIGKSYSTVENELKLAIKNAIRDHRYLERVFGNSTTEKAKLDRKLFNRYLKAGNELKRNEVQSGILFVSRLLHEYFGKKAFIFIDDYDVPFGNLYHQQYSGDEYTAYDYDQGFEDEQEEPEEGDVELILDLFRDVYNSTFIGNPYLEKGFVTGVFDIAEANLFAGQRQRVVECSSSSHLYTDYYGFTQREVEGLVKQFSLSANVLRRIERWYKGYSVPGTYKMIYSPWTISWYMQETRIYSYWLENLKEFLPDSLLLQSDTLQTDVRNLIAGQTISCAINARVSLNSTKLSDRQNALSVLFHAGYLTAAIGKNTAHDSNSPLTLTVPNRELMAYYERKLEDWLDVKGVVTCKGLVIDNYNVLVDLLLNNHLDEFEKRLNHTVYDRLACHGVHGEQASRVFYIISRFLLQSYEAEIDERYQRESIIMLKTLGRYQNNALVKITTSDEHVESDTSEVDKIFPMENSEGKNDTDVKNLVRMRIIFGIDHLRVLLRNNS